ncbi:MAG: 2-nitropropane dioxygenase, partial [Desulfamplus sp.]|nr:2-nitropropane dioxygenase [Desulfamplus sp.]
MFKGYWHNDNHSHYDSINATDIKEALIHTHEPVYLIENNKKNKWVWGGTALITNTINPDMQEKTGYFKIRAYAPALPLENLGDAGFKARHKLKYPYIAGAMANGITSVQMVESMARNGMIAFFGAGGLSIPEVENAIIRLKENLVPLKKNIECFDQSSQSSKASKLSQAESSSLSNAWGCNFIHSHGDPELEMALARLYLKYGVKTISAAAFMRITLALVYYRLKGIHRNMEGDIITPNKIIAKVSRVEVARQFFSPPPEKLVTELLNQGLISQDEAQLAPFIPMAQDLTAEADSGGHTDNRPAISLWPTMIALKDEFNQRFNYAEPLCVGFAGGIATPESAAAAFQMGAAYILTGSINQSCVEAGTSQSVKSLLAQAEQADVAMAPAADMFEIGARVQVLKRGTMFSVRAEKLYQVYKTYDCFEDVPDKLKTEIEEKYLQASFA